MSESSIDLETLRDSFREVLGDALPLEALFNSGEAGPALCKQMTELGWPGLAIPEEFGGLGLGFDALGVLYEEVGRSLAPVPLLPTMLVADAVLRGGSPEQRDAWLSRIATGELVASLTPPGDTPSVIAHRNGDDLVLSGMATGLLDGAQARLLLVAVELDGKTRRLGIEGVDAVPMPCFDLTRSIATAVLDGINVPACDLLPEDVENDLSEHAAIALACEAIGGAERILEITLDHLKTREQFGRVIGSFQALKHRVADHKTDLVAAATLANESAALRSRGEDVRLEASAAKAYACDVFAKLARDAIQLHGGIGVTWEHPCHLFLKRAKLSEALYGNTARHLDELMEGLLA